MELIITYLIYILALVAVVFLFMYFSTRKSANALKFDLIKFLIKEGYETDKIDLNNFIK